MAVDTLSATFAALADPTRRAILARLAAGETSVTPACRDAIWHLSVKWQVQYNDTLAGKTTGYQTLSAHIQ